MSLKISEKEKLETIKFREIINISNPVAIFCVSRYCSSSESKIEIEASNLVGTSHDLKDAIDRQVRVPLSKPVAIGNPVALINAS